MGVWEEEDRGNRLFILLMGQSRSASKYRETILPMYLIEFEMNFKFPPHTFVFILLPSMVNIIYFIFIINDVCLL